MPHDKPTQAEMQVSMIKRTRDPLSPIRLQKSHEALQVVGSMLRPLCKQEDVDRITTKICDALVDRSKLDTVSSEKQLDELTKDPEFSLALISMLIPALINFAVDTHMQVVGQFKEIERP